MLCTVGLRQVAITALSLVCIWPVKRGLLFLSVSLWWLSAIVQLTLGYADNRHGLLDEDRVVFVGWGWVSLGLGGFCGRLAQRKCNILVYSECWDSGGCNATLESAFTSGFLSRNPLNYLLAVAGRFRLIQVVVFTCCIWDTNSDLLDDEMDLDWDN